jgi:hypothetical protein
MFLMYLENVLQGEFSGLSTFCDIPVVPTFLWAYGGFPYGNVGSLAEA